MKTKLKKIRKVDETSVWCWHADWQMMRKLPQQPTCYLSSSQINAPLTFASPAVFCLSVVRPIRSRLRTHAVYCSLSTVLQSSNRFWVKEIYGITQRDTRSDKRTLIPFSVRSAPSSAPFICVLLVYCEREICVRTLVYINSVFYINICSFSI